MAFIADDGTTVSDAQLRERLLSHPNFDVAVGIYSRGLSGMHKASWLLNRLISHQESAFRVLGYMLYLDADREWWPDGANYSSLHELCTRRSEVGTRVLKTLLAIMQMAGLMKTMRSPTDKRVKLYRPTPRMSESSVGWLACMAQALDQLQPDLQREKRIRTDPDFVTHFLVTAGRDFITNMRTAERMPEFSAFFGRVGGSGLVLSLVWSAMERKPMPSRSRIASRYGLSKAQVSNVIAEGVEHGYIVLDDKGVPIATPHLHESYRHWVAIELAVAARHMV